MWGSIILSKWLEESQGFLESHCLHNEAPNTLDFNILLLLLTDTYNFRGGLQDKAEI